MKTKIEKVRMLLDKGTDVNAMDNDRKTALMWASYLGNKEIVEIVSKTPDTLNRLMLPPSALTNRMMDIIVRHCPHNRAYKPGKWMPEPSYPLFQ